MLAFLVGCAVVGSVVYLIKLVKEPVQYPEGMIDIASMPLSSTQVAPHGHVDANYDAVDETTKDSGHHSETLKADLDKIRDEFDPRVNAWYSRPEYSEPIARPYFNQYNPINDDV